MGLLRTLDSYSLVMDTPFLLSTKLELLPDRQERPTQHNREQNNGADRPSRVESPSCWFDSPSGPLPRPHLCSNEIRRCIEADFDRQSPIQTLLVLQAIKQHLRVQCMGAERRYDISDVPTRVDYQGQIPPEMPDDASRIRQRPSLARNTCVPVCGLLERHEVELTGTILHTHVNTYIYVYLLS